MRAVFLDRDTVDRGDVDLSGLEAVLPDWDYYPMTSPEQLPQRIANAEVIVSNKVVLHQAALAHAPKLKLICVAATGTNNVDLDAARQAGIVVCNVRAYSTPSVVQFTIGMMLALMMRLPEHQQALAAGAWQNSPIFSVLDFPFSEVAGKKLGIVGYGELGQAVAKVATALGMEVLLAARPGTAASDGRIALNELLPQVDVLSLHCPLTAETRNLIGADQLASMKSSAILLNLARGGIVDETALATALRQKVIAGAGVDVLSCEPPPADHPLLASDLPNLIVTPHIAWASVEARRRLVEQIALNIAAYLSGTPRNQVNL